MTAPKVHDEPVGHTAGQLVTWRDTEAVLLDADGPWPTVLPVDSNVGWSVHETEVSPR
ncbi:hypothetical protein SAMN05216188_11878 [Lentzea xinjiangensis]|uniref:Uncharacterized protein n=1 Tax=Lentzea xinjiangensis TaxID=402600 RepID=A0A1H9TFD9_9PSEU|nr:hypothetical protein [Lentzea xinjiangensis]SER95684.1 hypothetical protein SAMN05216188_11878 [Lentzea xinjiangensis]